MILRISQSGRYPQYRAKARALRMLGWLLFPAAAVCGPVEKGVMSGTGLRYWEWQGEGVLFRLTQRLPDQTRAFFMARGFEAEDADQIARRCVFQTMFKNIAPPGGSAVEFDLGEWTIDTGNGTRGLLTREDWDRRWEERGVPQAARIAFEWSLLPTRQRYLPGDFNWGMTSYGLPPGSRFDLRFSWMQDAARHRGSIPGVECPKDLHPEPQP
jgi:hypothetical protein